MGFAFWSVVLLAAGYWLLATGFDRYRRLFLDYSYATFLEDAAGVIIDANTAAAELLECERDEIIGRKHSDFLAPASFEHFRAQRQLLKPRQRLQFDAQYLAKGGQLRGVILDIALLPLEEAQGRQEVYLLAARESSRLDKLERELRLQRQSAHAGYRSLMYATFFISASHEISPYPPLLGGETARPLDRLHTLLLGPRFAPALERAWAGNEVNLPPAWYSPAELEGQMKPASGNPEEKASLALGARWLKIGFYPLHSRGAGTTDVCAHALDCTAERLLQEEQRRLAQRTSATLLTATLHQELNNYLGVILAQASGLRLAYQAGQLPPPHVGAIIDAAENAAGLLRHAVDRRLPGGVRYEIELNSLVADCAQLLPHMLQGRISVQAELAPGLPKVCGDASALKVMLLELLYYAEQGVPQDGRLLIQTCQVKMPYGGLPPAAGIVIQDNTPRAPTSASLPAPAKETEESLELALVRAVLREHRGQLEITYAASRGRVFEVTLPGLFAPAEQAAPPVMPGELEASQESGAVTAGLAAPTAESSPGQMGAAASVAPAARPHYKILLADDEENFRTFISWVLKEHGYEVLVANDGQEACERFQEAPQNIDLVILDAYMPRLGGLEAYLRMQVLRSDLPVLFASGFVRGSTADTLIDGCPGPAGVLLKPFTSEELLQSVKTALTPKED